LGGQNKVDAIKIDHDDGTTNWRHINLYESQIWLLQAISHTSNQFRISFFRSYF